MSDYGQHFYELLTEISISLGRIADYTDTLKATEELKRIDVEGHVFIIKAEYAVPLSTVTFSFKDEEYTIEVESTYVFPLHGRNHQFLRQAAHELLAAWNKRTYEVFKTSIRSCGFTEGVGQSICKELWSTVYYAMSGVLSKEPI